MANPLDFLRFSKKKKKASDSGQEPAESADLEVFEPGTDDPAPAVSPAEPSPSPAPSESPVDPATTELPPVVATPAGTATPGPERAPAAAPMEPLSVDPKRLYGDALKAVGAFFAAVSKPGGATPAPEELPIHDVEAVAERLVTALGSDESIGNELVAQAVGRYPDGGLFIVPHSVNVSVLSQLVGRQLGLSDAELFTLGLAALVHDVGTVLLPKEIFYKSGSLSNGDWELIRQRPAHSHAIISTLGTDYRAVAEIAYQVHERLDGHGYPRGLSVAEIALEASILGAVDIFEAFIHPRPFKKTVPAAAMYGVDNLMRMSHQFGGGVLRALVRSIGLFPVGTHVRLNSGEVAIILRGRPANPMRPEVEVVFDTKNRRLSETRFIDLMATPHLYVFKPLSGEDLVEIGL